MKRAPSYLEQMDRLKPFVVWMLARHGHKPITQKELSKRTGWSVRKIRTRFCGATTWADFKVSEVDTFRAACGINTKNEWEHVRYLKKTLNLQKVTSGLAHFRKHPKCAQNRIKKILIQLKLDAKKQQPAQS